MVADSFLNVLSVIYHPEERATYHHFLQQDSFYSYHLFEFEVAAAAERWVQQATPDVVLLDLDLPNRNGFVLLKSLRQRLSKAQTVIIALAKSHDPATAVAVMKEGAQDYLIKDRLTSKHLHQAIHQSVKQMQSERQTQFSQKQHELLATSTLRIRESLELDTILQTTATEVRQFLQVERVVVYQFHPDLSGTIVTESVLPGWKITLGTYIKDSCFQGEAGAYYRQGKRRAISSIYEADLTDCHIQMLETLQVKASLVVPILVNRELWGLLVAHQCSAPRDWQAVELDLLDHLAVQIAIAIQQASAYQQVLLLFKNNPIPMWVFDLETLAFLAVNNAAIAKYGYSQEEFLAMTIADIRPVEDIPRLLKTINSAGEGLDHVGSWKHYLKNGTLIYVDITLHPVSFEGRRAGLVMAQDITARRQAEEALQKSEERFRTFMDNSPAAAWITDLDGQIEYVSRTYRCMFQVPDDLVGRNAFEVYPQEIAQVYLDNIRVVATTNQVLETVEPGIRPDGSTGEFLVLKFPLPYLNRQTSVGGIAVDITERRKAEEERKRIADQILHNSLHDALTNLPNRKLLMQRLEIVIENSQQFQYPNFAILFLDLDHFKVINDSLGHLVGDDVLVMVAQKLQSLLRSEDVAARQGGDEFVLLLESVSSVEEPIAVAERILASLQDSFLVQEREVFINASIGIVMGSKAYQTPSNLLRDADTALYQAKARGRNQYVVFTEEMHIQAHQRMQLEQELRRAIDQEELVLYYQPIIEIATGQLCGLEALVRWHHPTQGLVPPDKFIPVAEETGLIVPLSRWVLRTACEQLAVWHQRFPKSADLTISVNLSAKDLLRPDLLAELDELLERTGLQGHHLNIEITESVLIESIQTAVVILKQLKARSAHITIDDFGTGYSSLSYLHQLPVDAFKIDRSFVNNMETNSRNSDIVETIITLSNRLGLHAIAEGIETEQQLQHLRLLGCELGQGYWFARPMPSEAMEAFFPTPPIGELG